MSTTGVQEEGAALHGGELGGADHLLGLGGFGHVQRDEVRLAQELAEAGAGAVVAHGQLRGDVVENDAHAEALGEHAELRADVAVADDAEGLAAQLVAAGGDLLPDALVHLAGAVGQLPREHHRLGQNQLGDAAGVAEGGVEDRHAVGVGRAQIDLVGADAEAADGEQTGGGGEHLVGDVGFATNAQHVDVVEPLGQGGAAEGAGGGLDLEPLGLEHRDGHGVNVFEEQHAQGVAHRAALGGNADGRGHGEVRGA
jgi:hypothetical protein